MILDRGGAPARTYAVGVTRCPRCHRRLTPNRDCVVHGRPSLVTEVPDLELARGIALPPGWRLGPRVATGGLAHVFAVERSGTTAILKLARWRERDVHARFEHEASVLRAIGSPRSPGLIAAAPPGDRAGLFVEHVAGVTLATWMSRTGDRGAFAEIVGLLSRIARALWALHAAGFAHGDVKPEHIAIGDATRLLDFSLA